MSKMTKKLIVEATGTGLLAFFALSSGGDPFVVASILAISIFAFGKVSGGHFNAAVTMAMYVRKEISCTDTVKYIVAQVVGALIAIALVNSLNDIQALKVGQLGGGVHPKGMFTEFLASAVLLFAIFGSIRSKISPAVGVGLAHIVLVPLGFTINTSIALASFLNGNALVVVLTFAVAQILGGIFAAKVDTALNK
ncbi:MAG: aquaporin [Alphaproteobacteria bacterium]